MNAKEDLSSYIQSHISMILNDVDTFIWLRTDKQTEYQEGTDKYGIGGGNFLATLGLLSSLDFLSQVYWILRKGIPVSIDKINHEDAFDALARDAVNRWGNKPEDIKRIWRYFRNNLTHMAFPNGMILALRIKDMNSYESHMNALYQIKEIPFNFDSNNKPICCYDLLLKEVEVICKWLSDEIQKDRFTEKDAQNVIDWINTTLNEQN